MTLSLQLYKPSSANQVGPCIYRTSIEGLLFISHTPNTDERGFFSEIVRLPEVEDTIGASFVPRQINHARSAANVVRGIHAEGWNKCTFITQGVAFCALVDVRSQSRTFRAKEYFLLGEGEDAIRGALFIASGIGNSLCVLKGPVDYIYIVDRLYRDRDPAGDKAISLFDPDLSIPWPIARDQMIISDRDRAAITLREKYPDLMKESGSGH